MFTKVYSLKKSRSVFTWANQWYKRHWKELAADQLNYLEEKLASLDHALLAKDRPKADSLAREVEIFGRPRFKKSPLSWLLELFGAIIFALVVATIIRQMWFENYQIPTGSMRPTYREMDHLIVSKTTYGINAPFIGGHIYFDPEAVQRGGVTIWSGANIDLPDTNTKYFWLFPVKKRYIKRMIGKPGDSLYFYGGKVWGVDAAGNELPELLELTDVEHLEYIPYTHFEGRTDTDQTDSGNKQQIFFRNFDQKIARLELSPTGARGEIFNGRSWVPDQPMESISDPHHIHTYSDIYGMGNVGMARLLTKEQVEKIDKIKSEEKVPLYLEIRHHPSVTLPRPRFYQDRRGKTHALLTPYVSVLPISEEKMKTLMQGVYTARFVVEQGFAHRYEAAGNYFYDDALPFPQIPDGTYEFYHGKAYAVKWGGYLEPLPADHPLYDLTPGHLQKLFNLGIEFSSYYAPSNADQLAYPARYAYFRDGDLYVMGAKLFSKDDETLKSFVAKEKEKQSKATAASPYIGFLDSGAPDKEKIKAFGLKVPEKHYVVLGDNHAMSGDSRYFGFVPEDNLEGTPKFILWPPGPRWGWATHKYYPWLTIPNIFVGSVVILISGIWYLYHRRKLSRPAFVKQK